MANTVFSRNRIPIRLTEERWTHVVTQHAELAALRLEILDTILRPERILADQNGEMLAVREVEAGKWLIVVYRELADDGFVITAFLTRRNQMLNKRKTIWSQ